MKRIFYVALLVVVMATAGYGIYSYRLPNHNKNISVLKTNVSTPASRVSEHLSQSDDKKILDLALPKTPLLMDHALELPDNQQDLHKLFEESQQEDTVSLGGRLIMDENPQPNAGVLDKVKGAEVGITIKTR